MIQSYLQNAAARALYQQLEDGSWFAHVRGLKGVVAIGSSVEACRGQLLEVVEEWVLVRVSRNLPVPRLDGVSIRVRTAS